jgi:hypothetical protein
MRLGAASALYAPSIRGFAHRVLPATYASRHQSTWSGRRRRSNAQPAKDQRATTALEVHDDFLPGQVQAEILRLMERPKWSFTGGHPPNQFWHMDGLEEEPFFREELYSLICERLGRTFDGIERVYANGQTAHQSGHPHQDDGDVTFLYYPNPVWERSWDGSLLFLKGGDVVQTVRYMPNRALLFPAKLVHYAEAPSESFTGLRVSLAYKLRVAAGMPRATHNAE